MLSPGTKFDPKVISLAVAACFTAGTAIANPTGPTVVSGQVSIHQAGNLLQITNSPNAILNWQSFSISAGEITRFIQQSAASAVLNRVTSANNPSVILGSLQSNGRVFLVNPSGVLFGAGAQVDVAGLVATSLNLSNADFLAGRMLFTETTGAGAVTNTGTINAQSGGEVYLIGSSTTNSGIITAPNGEVVLAAGQSVELVNPGTPNLRVEIAASDHEARNLGQIISDAGRIGIYAGLINNSGTIRADSAVAEGGRILLKATKSTTLESTSILSAQGNGGGRIEVLGGDEVRVAGLLDASAPNGGDGGFIETSALNVTIENGAVVTTMTPNGAAGTWLIDPNDFVIGRDITGSQLGTNLGTTSVVINSNQGGTLGSGDVLVNEAVTWSSGSSLTLTAIRSVFVNQALTSTGTGSINLFAGWDGISDPANPVLSTTLAFGTVSQTATGVITADKLRVEGAGVFLSSQFNGATNMVNTLAGRAYEGDFRFENGKSLNIGDVGGASGIIAGLSCCGNAMEIRVTSGDLTVSRDITLVGGNFDGTGTADLSLFANAGSITVTNSAVISAVGTGQGGNATIHLNTPKGSPGSITVTGGGSIKATGGSATGSGNGGNAIVTLDSDQSITVDKAATITATGGAADIKGAGTAAIGGQGGVMLIAANGGITVGGTITAIGGAGGQAKGGGVAQALGGFAGVTLQAGTSIAVNAGGSISAAGGAGGNASAGSSANASGGPANVELRAAGGITMDGAIAITGGAGGVAVAQFTQANGGDTGIFLNTPGAIAVAGTMTATGGSGQSGGSAFIDFFFDSCGQCFAPAGPITINGGTVLAVGGTGSTGGSADVFLSSSKTINATSAKVEAYASTGGVATVNLAAIGNITITGGEVAAETGIAAGSALADISAGGNITLSGVDIHATAENSAQTSIDASGTLTTANGGTISATAPTASVFLSGKGIFLGTGALAASSDIFLDSAGAISQANGGSLTAPIATFQAVSGIGTIANLIETKVGALSLSSQGGDIAIANTGDLVINGITLTGTGAGSCLGGVTNTCAAVGATGKISLGGAISIGSAPEPGDLLLSGNAGVLVDQNVTVSGKLEINSFSGSVDIRSKSGPVTVSADGPSLVLIGGAGVNIGSASSPAATTVSTPGTLAVSSGGGFTVRGGSGTGASTVVFGGNGLTVNALGNVIVEGGSGSGSFARIIGDPDVTMIVGGTVLVTPGTGGAASIESGLPSTIFIHFPNLSEGGFFVNGVEGAIVDGQGTSGFFADGSPAVLGQNLIVTYMPPFVPPPPAEVINPPPPPPETTSDSEDTVDKPDEKKKGLPVCSR